MRSSIAQHVIRNTGRHSVPLFAVLFLLWLPATLWGQSRFLSAVERSGFRSLTPHDSIAAFVRSLAVLPNVRVEEIAKSRNGRSLFAVHLASSVSRSAANPRTRVLLFAQQHGDEPSGKEALLMLLAKAAGGGYDSLLERLDLIIVPQMNPDGGEAGKRTTSDRIDLNRNHVLLTSPETKGLHDLFWRVQPQVSLDVHEFGSSREWEEAGLVKTADVQLGMLTNLNVSEPLRTFEHAVVYPFLAAHMAAAEYGFQEYIVGSPQSRIRHSTTDINDGRQSLGILGTVSFIQEGRNGKTPTDRLERRVRSQLKGIESLLECCYEHSVEINALVSDELRASQQSSGKDIVLRMEYVKGSTLECIPVHNLKTDRDTVWTISPLHDSVAVLTRRRLPAAYFVPKEATTVLELLQRHHVAFETIVSGRTMSGQRWVIDSLKNDTLEELSRHHPAVRLVPERIEARAGDVLVWTAQRHAKFLGTVLEPESMWGIVNYPGWEDVLKSGAFPIIRINEL